MSLTYSHMSNLVHEFFFRSIGVLDFSVVAHPCLYYHKLAKINNRSYPCDTSCQRHYYTRWFIVQVRDGRGMNKL